MIVCFLGWIVQLNPLTFTFKSLINIIALASFQSPSTNKLQIISQPFIYSNSVYREKWQNASRLSIQHFTNDFISGTADIPFLWPISDAGFVPEQPRNHVDFRKIRDFFDSLYNGSLDWTFDGNKQLEASLKYISDTSLLLLVDNNGLFCLYRFTEFFWIDVKAEINQ